MILKKHDADTYVALEYDAPFDLNSRYVDENIRGIFTRENSDACIDFRLDTEIMDACLDVDEIVQLAGLLKELQYSDMEK